jgi:hypothetical protein
MNFAYLFNITQKWSAVLPGKTSSNKTPVRSDCLKGLSSEFFRQPLSALALALTLGSSLLAVSCTSNRLSSLNTASTTTGNPLDGVIVSVNESALALTRVIKNASSPTSVFDLIGDGSGAFGNYCKSQAAGSGNTGASTCKCSYSYAMPDGSTQNYEADTDYHEQDLLRCKYIRIPAAVRSVDVRVHVNDTNMYSNVYTFKFSGGGVTLDTSDASTFALVQRYQCRDNIVVPYSLSPQDTVYDPFQSEDVHNSYPLNFYTTNMGLAMAYYAGGVKALGLAPPYDWNCPSIPNDPAHQMDLTIFSVGADSAGSKKIYPPTGSIFDRSNFYVAKQATSVFNIPINSMIAPTINTVSSDSQDNPSPVPPMGYGAAPIPTGVSGQETCPDSSITIPSGYHWVKVWLFRMALNTRRAYVSYNLQNLGLIACAPGEWRAPTSFIIDPNTGNPIASIYNSVFPDCYNNVSTITGNNRNTDSLYLSQLFNNGTRVADLASRYFVNSGACFNVDPNFHPASGLTGNGPGRANDGSATPINSLVGKGTDIWFPNQIYPGATPVSPLGCGGANPVDANPAHLCTPATPPLAVAYDDKPATIDIDDVSSPRYDFIFVVSPTTVMSGEITKPSSSVHNIYTPYRFMSLGDCNSPDPDNPSTVGDCDASRALRNYGIKFHDVGNIGDPPATDPNRPGVFPVCALQKDSS